jgi:hypothetical protein
MQVFGGCQITRQTIRRVGPVGRVASVVLVQSVQYRIGTGMVGRSVVGRSTVSVLIIIWKP